MLRLHCESETCTLSPSSLEGCSHSRKLRSVGYTVQGKARQPHPQGLSSFRPSLFSLPDGEKVRDLGNEVGWSAVDLNLD